MANTYLDFISDEDLFECIDDLYEGYVRALASKDIKAFFKERVDPIKFIFDSKIQDLPMEEYIGKEILRQIDKTISNHIGAFHENLLGKIEGYNLLAVGGGIDIESVDGLLFAEIKNKHNTVKGENHPEIFEKLESFVDTKNPDIRGYYVKIIDKKSQQAEWKFTSKGKAYANEQIYQVSGDKFYELVTGDPLAFSKLCSILPKALNDYINILPEEKIIEITEDATIVEEIKNLTNVENPNDREILNAIFKRNFPSYTGFEDFAITPFESDDSKDME